MNRDARAMKILEIENGVGRYRISDDGDWKPIDEIDKDDLLVLLDLFLERDVVMDNFEDKELSNQAHKIVYKSIYNKLDSLKANKNKFKDEADREYLDATKKYSKADP